MRKCSHTYVVVLRRLPRRERACACPLSFIRTHVLSRAVRCGLPAYVRLEMNVYERKAYPSAYVRRCTYVSERGQMFFNVRTFNVRLIVVAVRMYVYNVCIYI